MANTTDELYQRFLEVAGEQASGTAATQTLLSEILAEYRDIKGAQPAPAGSTSTSTSRSSSTSTAGASQSGGGIVETIASTILKNGFGVAPLVTGLIHLFGGGGSA